MIVCAIQHIEGDYGVCYTVGSIGCRVSSHNMYDMYVCCIRLCSGNVLRVSVEVY